MSRSFAVIYEARADFATATEITDRALLAAIGWLDGTLLDSQRRWISEAPLGSPLTWKTIPSRARGVGIRVHGHFNGEPGLPDAKAARRAIAFVLHELASVDAIVLIRDADDQNERRNGLEQARKIYSSDCTIVIGLAVPERECWVICGFQPVNDDENESLTLETEKLGWNPCLYSHGLTAGKDDQAIRSPKRVLAALTGGDRERQRECWLSPSLELLKERGQGNGLAQYLKEIRSCLVPLITR